MRPTLILVFGLFVVHATGMTLPITHHEDHEDRNDGDEVHDPAGEELPFTRSLLDQTFRKKRPILERKTYGFRHAQHMSSRYQTRGLKQLLGDRKKQSFPSIVQTDTRQCADADTDCRLHRSYRTIDGSCNNLKRPNWGQSDQPYKRLLPRKHSLVDCGNAALSLLPNARLASRLLAIRTEADVSNHLSMYLMVWGQFIDHDMMLTELRSTPDGDFLDCCNPENVDSQDCCPIKVPRGDFFFGKVERPDCIPFIRSKVTSFPKGCRNRLLPDVQNSNTGWLDLSCIYGSNEEIGNELKSEEGGKLKHSLDKAGRMFPHIAVEDDFRMVFGDSRGDVHPALTLLHTSFLRYHNILADRLAEMHPGWSNNKLFNEARKINVAIEQHITYTQFADALLGIPNDVRTNDRELHHDYYRQSVDPRISMIFSTAAFRLHTQVSGNFELKDARYRTIKSLLLRDVFHDPLKLLANNTYDELTRGLVAQSVHEFNNAYSSEMTEWLFAEKDEDFGLDIISLNIQRGRDHQIQGYASFKEHCGLGSVNDWDDFEDLITHENVHRMLHTYRKPEDVDMYVGANMEVPVKGAMIGPTMHCYVREQLENLREGDRFFYTRPSEFSRDQLAAIKKMTLSHILCATSDNPGSMGLPRNAFVKPHIRTNPVFPCSKFPDLDLSHWR